MLHKQREIKWHLISSSEIRWLSSSKIGQEEFSGTDIAFKRRKMIFVACLWITVLRSRSFLEYGWFKRGER